MWAGRVVLGRYTVRAPLPGTSELVRWEATDNATGDVVEVVAPSGVAALRPGAESTFAQANRGLPESPAVLAPLAAGTEGSLPVAIRPPVGALWDASRRLRPEEALALAAWLGPAVLACADQLGEGLRAEDLVIDTSGTVRLAPAGLRASDGIHPPPRHRAPETSHGETADGAAALYGLGVLLFRAVTGQEAVPGETTPAWSAAQSTPRRASSLLPDLPVALDLLLMGLLSPDPARRLAALAALPPGQPVHIEARTAAAAAPKKAGTAARPLPSARADLGLGSWVVSVRPGDLTLAAKRKAAALAGVPSGAMVRLAEAGHPAPIFEARTREEAEARARDLAALGLPVRVASGDPPWGLGVAAAGAFALALLVGVIGLFVLPLLAIPVAFLLALAGLVAAVGAGVRASAGAALRTGKSHLHAVDNSPSAPVAARMSAVRAALLNGDLPEPMRVDLLAALDETEDRLDALSDADDAATATARAKILADTEEIAAATTRAPIEEAGQRTQATLRAARATLAGTASKD